MALLVLHGRDYIRQRTQRLINSLRFLEPLTLHFREIQSLWPRQINQWKSDYFLLVDNRTIHFLVTFLFFDLVSMLLTLLTLPGYQLNLQNRVTPRRLFITGSLCHSPVLLWLFQQLIHLLLVVNTHIFRLISAELVGLSHFVRDVKQVSDLLIIDFLKTNLNTSLLWVDLLEYLQQRPRNDTLRLFRTQRTSISAHRKGLTTASLSIRKNANIVAINKWLNDGLDLLKNISLLALVPENLIKHEGVRLGLLLTHSLLDVSVRWNN